MKPVRWGVLSTARIARQKVVPGMLKSPHIEVVAVASRTLAAAQAFANEIGAARAYGSYEELLADPDVEAIYNPLPNHLHVPLTLAAARAGKHVLCEKPIAITAAEAEQLRDAPGDILIAEAFMIRHHPQWIKAQELVAAGRIGEVRAVQVAFCYMNEDPANIRNNPEIGGGGLLDIGCYAIMSGRLLFDDTPVRAVSLIRRSEQFGTDVLSSGVIAFARGGHLTFTVSTGLAPFQRVQALGTQGRIEIPIAFNPVQDEATSLILDDGSRHGGASGVTIDIAPADQYRLQGEAFGRAVRGLEPLVAGVEDAILNMRVLDALFRSETSGAWEDIAAR